MNNDLQTGEKRILVGLFSNKENAENAYEALRKAGYSSDEINVVMNPETRKKYYKDEEITRNESGSKALEGAGAGGTIGGVLGGIGAAIAALGSNLIIPGLG